MDNPRSMKRRTVPAHEGGGPDAMDVAYSQQQPELVVAREADVLMLRWKYPNEAPPSDLLPNDALWWAERSSSPFGPWTRFVTRLARTARQVRDDVGFTGRGDTRKIYYRVGWSSESLSQERTFGLHGPWEEVHRPGGVTWGSEGTAPHLIPGVVRELRQRSLMEVRRLGAPFLVYRPAWLNPPTQGQVNPLTGSYFGDPDPSDLASHGSVFGGYDHPFMIRAISHHPSPVTVSVALGRVDDLGPSVVLVCAFWPCLQVDDLLRSYSGEIFQVISLHPSMIHDHVFQMTVSAIPLGREHPLNALPMPEDFLTHPRHPRAGLSVRLTRPEAYAESLDRGAAGRQSVQRPMTYVDPWGED